LIAKMTDAPTTSYQALPIRLRPTSRIVRHVYLKAHVGDDSLPKERTLFVAGLPVALDEGALLQLFSRFGQVERAAVHGSRVSAVVMYAAASGRAAALKAAAKGKAVELDVAPPPRAHGLKGWVEAHKAAKPGNAELQRQLDEWTEAFETEEAAAREAALAATAGDGWTVVQRHRGRKKNTSESGVTVGAVAAGAAAAQAAGKQAPLHANFYRFQQREQRRTELLDLRERFEQDKKRLAELKMARKFNPM
jgi:hypothetical protein